MLTRPSPGDFAPFFQGYVDRVPDGDVLQGLADQADRMRRMLLAADERTGNHRYAPDKWTVKQIVQHLTDGERMFCYRAMCVARGDTQELPQFDENAYADHDGSDGRTLAQIVEEYGTVRAATITLFRGFDATAFARRGSANGQPIAVHALPWIVLGHDLHHCGVLLERYGLRPAD